MRCRAVPLVSVAFLIACLGATSWAVDRAPVSGPPGPMAIRSDEELGVLEAASEKAYLEGRYQEAIRLYSQALRRYPSCSRFYFGRGMAYEMVRNPAAAMRDYREALRLDPLDYRAMEGLAGIIERTGGSTEEAVKLYKEALMLDVRPEWKENLAVWIRILESTLRADTDSPVASWHLGNSLAREAKLEEAAARYSRAIELNPLFFQAYYSRGLLRLKAGDPEGALPDLNVAIDLSPGLRGALVQRALVHENLGNGQRAINDLRRAVHADPGDPEAHYHYGRMLQDQGDYLAAAESLQQALRLKPKPDLRALIYRRIAALHGVVALRDSDRGRIRRMLRQLW